MLSPSIENESSWYARLRRFLVHDILHADDPPHRLALGIALGVFVSFLPIMGCQMLVVICLAWVLRANKAVGVPIVWLTNPMTAVPVFYGCYWLGTQILGVPDVGRQWWSDLLHPPPGIGAGADFFMRRLWEVAYPLTIGCTLVGFVAALPCYPIALYLIRYYRLKRWGQVTVPDAMATPAPHAGTESRVATHTGHARFESDDGDLPVTTGSGS